ncbi:hypothetical protein J0910_04090 [Nocardiopsis sp. CNT-189]|uniref:hypothetical protein n=1 Tax=Nocardiopsis oceanisediminis TaxID=2816862 RepID=UPI003B363533
MGWYETVNDRRRRRLPGLLGGVAIGILMLTAASCATSGADGSPSEEGDSPETSENLSASWVTRVVRVYLISEQFEEFSEPEKEEYLAGVDNYRGESVDILTSGGIVEEEEGGGLEVVQDYQKWKFWDRLNEEGGDFADFQIALDESLWELAEEREVEVCEKKVKGVEIRREYMENHFSPSDTQEEQVAKIENYFSC